MSTLVSTLLARICVDLQEDTSFSSNLWSATEMLEYVNYSEVDFLRRTGITKVDISFTVGGSGGSILSGVEFYGYAEYYDTGITPVVIPPGSTITFPKPIWCMDIERISFNQIRLYRTTIWDLQRENHSWAIQPAGNPRYYHEDNLSINTFQVDRMPVAGGIFRIFADYLPPRHLTSNEYISVPDAWEQYIRWLVLSLALSKDGDGQDLARSKYAQDRYMFGVSLARRMALGEMKGPV